MISPTDKRKLPKSDAEKYIYWNDDRGSYRCIITTGKLKVPQQRDFSASYYGSKELALKGAIEWRDNVLAELSIPLTKTKVKAMHLSKPNDMVGLFLSHKTHKNTVYYGWSATLSATEKTTFWIGSTTNTYEQAYQRARAVREAHTGISLRENPPPLETMLALRKEWRNTRYTEQIPEPGAETHKPLLSSIPGIYLALRTGLPPHDINSYDWVVNYDPIPSRGSRKKSMGVRRYGWQQGYERCVDIRNQVSNFVYPVQAPSFEDMLALRPKVPEKRDGRSL